MRVLVIGGLPESLVNFRGPLLKALLAAGHQVVAMAAPAAPATVAAIESQGPGLRFRSFPLARNGLDPRQDGQTLRALRYALREEKPDAVLAYTIKPVVWGGLALASLGWGARRTRFYALVTGLGYAFQGQGTVRRLLARLVAGLYRGALVRARLVFFQNIDNRELFVSLGLVPRARTRVVAGSGVDVARYAATPLPDTDNRRVVFLLIARLLGEKGLREYAAAARQVRAVHPEAVFRLLGPADPSPDGIPLATVEAWVAAGDIEYLGEAADVRPHLAACHVYVLPSYHEGMPRTVLEAMACGRPVLTTDIPGARETVQPGESGWLVPPRDAAALAERCRWFVEHPEAWAPMGLAGRQRAESVFDVHRVNRDMLVAMDLA